MQIVMPRGDLRNVRFNILNTSKEQITNFTDIFFTVKRNTSSSNYVMQKRLSRNEIVLDSEGYFHFQIAPEDTDNLDYGNYKFDIEIVGEGIKQTFLGELILKDEVTFASNEGV